MQSLQLKLVVLVSLFGLARPQLKIPDGVHACQKSDLNRCLRDSLQKLRPTLAEGDAATGILPFEPLLHEYAEVRQGDILKVIFRNEIVKGFGNYTVRDVKMDLAKDTFDIKISTPRIRSDSSYEINGRILLLPISGKGTQWYELDDVTCTMKGFCERVSRDGKTHYKLKDITVAFDFKNARLHLNNLFNGDRLLGETMNRFLNENFKDLIESTGDAFFQPMRKYMKEYFPKIFELYALNDVIQDL